MKRILVLFLLAAAAFVPGFAEQSYDVQGVTFTLPVSFGPAQKAGLHAQQLQFPAAGNEPKMELIVYLATAEERKALSEGGQDIGKYFRTTFFGASETPEQVNKAVIGDKGGRHLVFHTTIPKPARLDVFERELEDGRFLGLGLRTTNEVSEEERIAVSEALRKTVKVTP